MAHVSGDVRGDDAQAGRKKRINGASGAIATILVPRGVVVRELVPEAATGAGATTELRQVGRSSTAPPRQFRAGEVIAELNAAGDTAIVAKGGRGGNGNNMARAHEATSGSPGEERWIELELKLVANVGLIGAPNAGKSSLLGALSRACPKIAPYPFTTVAPYIGRAEFTDGSYVTVADVPGLVENAHLGEGLGHDFLRHLERTQVLLYVIDVARSHDPFGEFLALQREVALYSREMAAKPCGLVANKCDIAPDVTLQRADELFRAVVACRVGAESNMPIFVRATSARYGEGIPGLLQEVRKILQGEHEGCLARGPGNLSA